MEAESLPDPLETLDRAFIRVRKGCPDWETRIGMLKSENQPPEKPAYVFLDCETADASGQICAVGLVYDPPEEKPEEYYTLVNPERPMQAENLAIHGITRRDGEGCPHLPGDLAEAAKISRRERAGRPLGAVGAEPLLSKEHDGAVRAVVRGGAGISAPAGRPRRCCRRWKTTGSTPSVNISASARPPQTR